MPDVKTIIGAVLRTSDSCHHADDCFPARSGPTGGTGGLFREYFKRGIMEYKRRGNREYSRRGIM